MHCNSNNYFILTFSLGDDEETPPQVDEVRVRPHLLHHGQEGVILTNTLQPAFLNKSVFSQLFSSYSLALWFFGKIILVQKLLACKMLVILTIGQRREHGFDSWSGRWFCSLWPRTVHHGSGTPGWTEHSWRWPSGTWSGNIFKTIIKSEYNLRPCKTGKFSLRPYQNDYWN